MKFHRNLPAMFTVAGIAFMAGRLGLLAVHDSVAAAAPKDPFKEVGGKAKEIRSKPDRDMQAMMDAGTPGAHHQALEPTIGAFEAVVRFTMEPGAPMIESKGIVKREWVHDGRFVMETVEAESMGSPYRATGYIGYNNIDGQYEIVWMDNHSTAIMFETGSMNLDTKVMTMQGSRRDPGSGRLIKNSGTWDMSNPDRQTSSGFTLDENGREYKSFEGVFERVKK